MNEVKPAKNISAIKIILFVVVNTVYFLYILASILNFVQLSRPNFELEKLYVGTQKLKQTLNDSINFSRLYYFDLTRKTLIYNVLFLIFSNLIIAKNGFVILWNQLKNIFSEKRQIWPKIIYGFLSLLFFGIFINPFLMINFPSNILSNYQSSWYIILEVCLLASMFLKKYRRKDIKKVILVVLIVQCAFSLYDFLAFKSFNTSDLKPYKSNDEIGKFIAKCAQKFGFTDKFIQFISVENNYLHIDPNTFHRYGSKAFPFYVIINPDSTVPLSPADTFDLAVYFGLIYRHQFLIYFFSDLLLKTFASVCLILMFESDKFLSAFGVDAEEHPNIVHYLVSRFALSHFLQIFVWLQIPVYSFLLNHVDNLVFEILGKDMMIVGMCQSFIYNHDFVYLSDLFNVLNYQWLSEMTRLTRIMKK